MRQQKKERKHSGGWQLWWHLSLHGRWQEQKIMATTLVIFYACRSVGWPKWPAKATENAACLGWFMLLNRGNNNIPENRYYSKEAGISISLLDEDLLLDLCTASFTSPMLLLLLSTLLAGWPSLIQVPLWFVRNFNMAKYLLPRDRYLIGFISSCWVRCSVALKLLLRSAFSTAAKSARALWIPYVRAFITEDFDNFYDFDAGCFDEFDDFGLFGSLRF